MTKQEFSDTFDTLLSSFIKSGAYGENLGVVEFDEYEKSVFLTKAQEEVILSRYNGRNIARLSFESSEEVRRNLAFLVRQEEVVDFDSTSTKISSDYQVVKLDDDVWFIVFESADWDPESSGCLPYKNIAVQPITHDEYHKIKDNPFRGANNHRVLRLDIDSNEDGQYVELISKYTIATYRYRYLKKPNPIILVTELPDDLTIYGQQSAEIEDLPVDMQNMIIETAVRLALQSRSITKNE